MSIYNREQTIAQDVKAIQRDQAEIKSTQVVGNDNLVVNYYYQFLPGPIPVTGSTIAQFKAVFTFDEPSTSYVTIEFIWESQDVFQYQENVYDDPDTMASPTEQAAFITIGPSADMEMDYIETVAKTTARGSLSLVRIS